MPPDTRANFLAFAQREFREHRALDKKDFAAIEYLLRKGERQLDIYQSPGIKNLR
ncbi:hypothetical protein B0A49_02816 [Cryomyces minteri]|uniref:Complex 1 LYR protein domain-containing protein n=1 Tax=Cryomyces minteri TaxID=331657 RepID=A0A4U0XHB7_9PEZI|nr:hypothetical protein B0A49_02816 [Cryomyces minteri]